MDGGTVEPAKPLRQRANVAMILVGAVILAAIASLVADLGQLDLANRAVDGERITLSEVSDSDDAVGLTATIYVIAFALAGIAFLLWYSRAYRNLPALGRRDPRYGPRWAIAYWFIPIVNFFRPKQVMNDIWRGSDPDDDQPVTGWHELPIPPLYNFWWGLWLLNIFISPGFNSGANTAQELQSEFTRYVIVDVLDIVVGVLAILVIRTTTDRQEERRRRVELEGPALSVGEPPPATPLPATSD